MLTEQVCLDQPISAVLKWLVSADAAPRTPNEGNRLGLASTDPEDWLLWEVGARHGIRRALRPAEYLRHVVQTWPSSSPKTSSGKQRPDYFLELGSSDMRLDTGSCASLCPRRDLINAGPTGPSFTAPQAEMFHRVLTHDGEVAWTRVNVSVAQNELVVAHARGKYKPKRVALPTADLYEAAAQLAQGCPGRYVLVVRSQVPAGAGGAEKGQGLVVLGTKSGTVFEGLRNVVFSVRQKRVDLESREMRVRMGQ